MDPRGALNGDNDAPPPPDSHLSLEFPSMRIILPYATNSSFIEHNHEMAGWAAAPPPPLHPSIATRSDLMIVVPLLLLLLLMPRRLRRAQGQSARLRCPPRPPESSSSPIPCTLQSKRYHRNLLQVLGAQPCPTGAQLPLPHGAQHPLSTEMCFAPLQDKIRDVPLTSLEVPILWVRGTKDDFCSQEAFDGVLPRMQSKLLKVGLLFIAMESWMASLLLPSRILLLYSSSRSSTTSSISLHSKAFSPPSSSPHCFPHPAAPRPLPLPLPFPSLSFSHLLHSPLPFPSLPLPPALSAMLAPFDPIKTKAMSGTLSWLL